MPQPVMMTFVGAIRINLADITGVCVSYTNSLVGHEQMDARLCRPYHHKLVDIYFKRWRYVGGGRIYIKLSNR